MTTMRILARLLVLVVIRCGWSVGVLTGLGRDLVASRNGRVSAETFVKEVMRRQYKLLDRYDGTQASDDPLSEHPEFATLDRSLLLLNGVLSAPFLHGYHDRSTLHFLLRCLVEQSVLSPRARQRVLFGTQPGGHMFYLQARSREEMSEDLQTLHR